MSKRIEFFFNFNFNYFPYTQSLFNSLNFFFCKDFKFFFNKYKIFNLYFFYLIFNYKGLRHLKSLPVRGQRTWTNAKTSSLNNQLLNYKITLLKKFLNTNNLLLINSYHYLELINLIWKLNWLTEWYDLKKKRLFYLKKKSKNIKFKFDEFSINLELASIRSRLLKKKSKITSKGSYVALGFEPGSALNYIK